MSRRISPEFYEHLQGSTTTVCEAVRFRLDDGRIFGICGLDKDLFWDNMWWRSVSGLNSKDFSSDTELSVDNSEVSILMSAMYQDGLTFEELQAGVLDNGTYEFFIVNYQDTEQYLRLDAGDIGEVKVKSLDETTIELLSHAVRLRSGTGTVTSVRCRAIFGTYANSQTGCGVNADIMWEDGVVTGVSDVEKQSVFADSSTPLTEESNNYRVRFTSGRNKSPRLYQVEGYSLISGTIALIEPTRFPIEVGDTFQIRPDCNKLPDDCKKYSNIINYKGEPYIPVADGLEGLTPNAQLAGGVTGGVSIDD